MRYVSKLTIALSPSYVQDYSICRNGTERNGRRKQMCSKWWFEKRLSNEDKSLWKPKLLFSNIFKTNKNEKGSWIHRLRTKGGDSKITELFIHWIVSSFKQVGLFCPCLSICLIGFPCKTKDFPTTLVGRLCSWKKKIVASVNLYFILSLGKNNLLFYMHVDRFRMFVETSAHLQSSGGHNFKPIFTKLHQLLKLVDRQTPSYFWGQNGKRTSHSKRSTTS